MIHASTQTGAERAHREGIVPVRRLGSRSFAALLGVELVVLVAVLFWAIFALIPPATPLAAATDLAPVEAAIRARLSGEVNDPLITVADGRSARTSNLRGFSFAGETYYYYAEGMANFDPLSRGAVSQDEIEVLLRDESGPRPFVLYRVR